MERSGVKLVAEVSLRGADRGSVRARRSTHGRAVPACEARFPRRENNGVDLRAALRKRERRERARQANEGEEVEEKEEKSDNEGRRERERGGDARRVHIRPCRGRVVSAADRSRRCPRRRPRSVPSVASERRRRRGGDESVVCAVLLERAGRKTSARGERERAR